MDFNPRLDSVIQYCRTNEIELQSFSILHTNYMMSEAAKINYLEFPAKDLAATKTFFNTVFDWQFTDYGPEYVAFDKSAGLDGGFYLSKQKARVDTGSVLVVFYSDNLADIQAKIEQAGGEISQAVFKFPGGRRFHFLDPNGNEFAVWSE